MSVPNELKVIPQWVTFKVVPRDDGRTDKVPYNPANGRKAKANDPTTWGSYQTALQSFSVDGADGLGYMFTELDHNAGVDLDECVEDGTIEPWAWHIVQRLNSYTELSYTGTGLHILVHGTLPVGEGNHKGKIEMYDRGRFFTVTGQHLDGTPLTIEDRDAELKAIHEEVFGKQEERQDAQRPTQTVNLADVELLALARNARNGGKFAKLWQGDITGYPSQSEADLALCSLLAFWTGRDTEKMDRLFRQSDLYRDKWDREDYRAGTIALAIANTQEVYHPAEPRTGAKRSTPNEQEGPPASYHLSDTGNAKRLVSQHGQNLRYCHPWTRWLVWDGTHWAPDDTAAVERKAKATVATIYAEAAAAVDDDRRKAIAKHAMHSEARFRIRAMMGLATSELGIPVLPDDLDATLWLLNCANGTLDLRTGELLPHRQSNLITKLAPVAYDPGATCPRWLAFLDKILAKNEQLIGFLQRAIGYALTGDTSEQCFFILHGSGANGKSTLLQTITALLGDYAKRTPTETLLIKRNAGIPNDVAALMGARMVSALESEQGERLAESLVKGMTGGDTLAARFLHREWFEFAPVFKIFLGTNHKPIIRGTDLAIWRRIRLIPFTVTIPEAEQDKHLVDKLAEELPGILAWAVQGCLEWQQNGLGAPEEVTKATEGYRTDMDPLCGFIDTCCVQNKQATARAGLLYESYRKWAEGTGERPISNRAFADSLIERGFDRDKDTKGRFYEGIGLLEKKSAEETQKSMEGMEA